MDRWMRGGEGKGGVGEWMDGWVGGWVYRLTDRGRQSGRKQETDPRVGAVKRGSEF